MLYFLFVMLPLAQEKHLCGGYFVGFKETFKSHSFTEVLFYRKFCRVRRHQRTEVIYGFRFNKADSRHSFAEVLLSLPKVPKSAFFVETVRTR